MCRDRNASHYERLPYATPIQWNVQPFSISDRPRGDRPTHWRRAHTHLNSAHSAPSSPMASTRKCVFPTGAVSVSATSVREDGQKSSKKGVRPPPRARNHSAIAPESRSICQVLFPIRTPLGISGYAQLSAAVQTSGKGQAQTLRLPMRSYGRQTREIDRLGCNRPSEVLGGRSAASFYRLPNPKFVISGLMVPSARPARM
jgi:hypothetical protein